MALKIMTCVINSSWLGHYRFQLIWELQVSIYDPAFCTKPSSPETSKPLDEDGYQSVCAFVRSRCKDLMVTSRDHHGGHLDYQHRVIHDFIFSRKMQSSLDAVLPEYFRQSQFPFQVGLSLVKQLYARNVYHTKRDLRDPLDPGGKSSLVVLSSHLQLYLFKPRGPLDENVLQVCAEMATAIAKLREPETHLKKLYLLCLTLDLARVQQFAPMSEIIRLGSSRCSDHTGLAYAMKHGRLHENWPRSRTWPIRRMVSPSEQHAQVIDPTSSRVGPYYLPCERTWWTSFLSHSGVKFVEQEDDVGPVWSLSRAVTHMAKAFLDAGASVDLELGLS